MTSQSWRTQNLEKANQVKRAQRHLRRSVAADLVSVASIIEEPPKFARAMRLDDLLLSQPDWDRDRVEEFCDRQKMPDIITLGALTVRQRLALSRALQG